jgi:hypothetical protein
MPHSNVRVQAVIDRFVSELATIAREEAARIVLDGIAPSPRGHKPASNGVRTRPSSAGEKRSPAKLAALQTKLLSYIKAHAGMRVEQINESLGTETKDLALPIKKLIVAKQIRAEGTRRATKYFAGSAKGATKAKKRAK